MTCQRIEEENLAERYVSGTLDPELKERFEQHYFACEACARKVDTWLAIQQPLRDAAPAIRQEMEPEPAHRSWIGGVAAIAAGVLVIAGVSVIPRTGDGVPPPVAVSRGADLAELARLDPPTYAPPALRGVETSAETLFREAMKAYLQRDYTRAIAGLRSSLALDPQAGAPRFFLGATQLLAGQTAEGVRELEQIAASNSPFAEEARFDLAKGYLQLGRRADALHALRSVVSERGEFAAQARTLIDRLGSE
jgi:anti-sigma factor RsiW